MVAGCCEALHEVERPPNSHHNARMSQGTSYDERPPSEKENLTNMATDINNADDERGKKPKRDALMKARAQKPRGRRFIVGSQSPSAAANGMFNRKNRLPRSRQSVKPRASCSTTRSARWWPRWSATLSVL
jgi:hypothetical protein